MSEGIVRYAYLGAGFTVSFRFERSETIWSSMPLPLFEIQVNTAWLPELRPLKSAHSPSGIAARVQGWKVDYFAAYCPNNESIYAVPAENHGVEGRLRLDPAKNNQAKLLKWAVDYSWEHHVEELKKLVRLARIELATSCSGDRRSIH